MTNIFNPNFLIISTMLIGMVNLIAPYINKRDTKKRSVLLLTISSAFFLNILIIDYLFVQGIELNFNLINIGKYSIAFGLEPLGVIFLTLIAFFWTPALLYTIKFLAVNEFNNSSRYLMFVSGCVLSGCFVALSWNLITMFVGYEMLTLCTIPLIIHQISGKSVDGLLKYLKILMVSGLLLFLPAIIFVYSSIGSGTFVNGGFIREYFSDTTSVLLLIAFVFGVSKTALYPLHGWLPAAMVASYPVSALLHAVVVVKTGLFCIYKILFYVFGLDYLQYLFTQYNWFILLPAFTILYSSVQAVRSSEIKMILAYSTINQLSLALISAFLFTPKGMMAAVIHMVSHAFTKICMFYSAGNFYSLKKTYYTNQLAGISKTMPKTSFIMLISGLSLVGMPPFAGFISKFYIMLAAAEVQNFFVMIVVGISSVFSSVYMIKIISMIYKKPPETAINIQDKNIHAYSGKKETSLPIFMLLSLAICVSMVICFFFIWQIISLFLSFL